MSSVLGESEMATMMWVCTSAVGAADEDYEGPPLQVECRHHLVACNIGLSKAAPTHELEKHFL